MLLKYEFINIVMYDELEDRREFVHDCFIMATLNRSEELMEALILDEHFYITREDLLILMQTNQNNIIRRLLAEGSKLLVQEGEGYYLVQIKKEQVNNQ